MTRWSLALVAGALMVTGALTIAAPALAQARRAPPAKITDYFTQDEIRRADRYRGPRTLLVLSGMVLNLAVLGLLGLGQGSRRLGTWAAGLTPSWWRQALLLALLLTAIPFVVSIPLHVAGWAHARDFGLATNSLPAALLDDLKGFAFAVGANALAGLAFIGVARAAPRLWPLAAGLAIGALTFAFVFLFPLVYEPAFNRFTPVDDATRARIIALASTEGVRVADVLVADASRRTTAKNAYVSGLGASRRVVLYDTLLAGSSPREIDMVVAHELAHVKHRDVLKGTTLGVVGVFAGIGLVWLLLRRTAFAEWIGASGPGDPRLLPFLAFFVAAATLVSLPAINALSRRIEASADRTAIRTTDDPETAITLEVNLARSNLSDLTPNAFLRWAFHTHPTTLERIQAARDYQAAHGTAPQP